MSDEAACAALMSRASYYADMHRIDDFVALFADDGRLEVRGERFIGAEAIRGFMDHRNRNRVTCHVLAPPIIDFATAEEGQGIALFTLFDAIDAVGERPLPMTLPAAVGEFRQSYRKHAGQWRVESHESVVTFRRG